MSIKKAAYPARVKATDQAQGIFEAIVSVFGNVDLVGDRVVKGAFTKSLADWKASGDPIPVVWSHQWDNLDAIAGQVLEAEERDEGLYIKAQLDMEEEFAQRLFRKMQKRQIREFSFAYDVLVEQRAKDGANDLLQLGLIETGPCLKGINPETELLTVKSRAKFYGALTGSVEERQQAINDAVREAHGGPQIWTWIVATYPDRVVFSVETQEQAATYFEAGYTIDTDNLVTLDTPTPVEINATIVRKARDLVKAGRVLSKSNEEKLAQARELLDVVLSSVQKEDDAGKASDRKPEEPDGAKGEAGGDTTTALMLLDLEELEVIT